MSGRVRNGDEKPDDGSAPGDRDQTFALSAEEEAEIDAALAEIERGEVVDAAEVLKQIRSRHVP